MTPFFKPRVPITKKRVVVHLGNSGLGRIGESNYQKTRAYSERFKGMQFIGISKKSKDFAKPIGGLPKIKKKQRTESAPKGWTQLNEDFLSGLKRIPKGTVDVISSDLAFGWYTKRGYDIIKGRENYKTSLRNGKYFQKVIEAAHKALKKGGKFYIAIDGAHLEGTMKALSASENKFSVTVRGFTKSEYTRTFWTQVIGETNALYQITAVKK